jgi:hypothetical protein
MFLNDMLCYAQLNHSNAVESSLRHQYERLDHLCACALWPAIDVSQPLARVPHWNTKPNPPLILQVISAGKITCTTIHVVLSLVLDPALSLPIN